MEMLLHLKLYFSGGGGNKLNKVEAFVAVEITPGPYLEEESVKDGLYGFRFLFQQFSLFRELSFQNPQL